MRAEFQEVLYAHPEAGGYTAADFDALFSAAFAQTLAFGLLLVREATDRPRRTQLGQPVLHYAADEPRGMRHQRRQVPGVPRRRLLSRAGRQHLDEPQERSGIVSVDLPVGAGVVVLGPQAALWNDVGRADLLVAMEQPQFGEVAARPASELLQPVMLPLVVAAPPRRVGRLRRRLELDEGAGGAPARYPAFRRRGFGIPAPRSGSARSAEQQSIPRAAAGMQEPEPSPPRRGSPGAVP